MKTKLSLLFLLICSGFVFAGSQEQKLARWLKQYPDADANGDGRLTVQEATAYSRKLRSQAASDQPSIQKGVPTQFKVDPGWDSERFPDHAICYRSPQEIKAIYAKTLRANQKPVTSYPGTGHSFMGPGYKTFPIICRAAGFEQPLFTHTGGGITGSTRYKWEQENGIFQFDGNPKPKLLASISNAQWDAMMWGPYFNDRPAYYACWIEFCLKYNPHMKFYLSDAWPQLGQLDQIPTSEDVLTAETFVRLGNERNARTAELIAALNKKYPRSTRSIQAKSLSCQPPTQWSSPRCTTTEANYRASRASTAPWARRNARSGEIASATSGPVSIASRVMCPVSIASRVMCSMPRSMPARPNLSKAISDSADPPTSRAESLTASSER